jgi:hypothetical protein
LEQAGQVHLQQHQEDQLETQVYSLLFHHQQVAAAHRMVRQFAPAEQVVQAVAAQGAVVAQHLPVAQETQAVILL